MRNNVRQISVFGEIAKIPLTKGFEAEIDASDLSLVKDYNWCALQSLHTVYAVRSDYSTGKFRLVYLHRQIMGEPKEFQIDHKDRNGLNNKRSNLRLATQEQNKRNTSIRANNTSGYKGVCWHKATGKWGASIKSNKKQLHLGLFDTPQEAHAAYAAASKELHGEFGRTN